MRKYIIWTRRVEHYKSCLNLFRSTSTKLIPLGEETAMARYSSWSAEELIKRVDDLEGQLRELNERLVETQPLISRHFKLIH